MALDYGKTTGVAYLLMDSDQADSLVSFSALEIRAEEYPLDESWADMYRRKAFILAQMMWRFERHAVDNLGLVPSRVHLVGEDFLLSPNNNAHQRDTLAPVYLAHMAEGIRLGRHHVLETNGVQLRPMAKLHLVQPSARASANDGRLKRGGLYIRGLQHARDATRHAVMHAMRTGYGGLFRERRDRPDAFWPPKAQP